MQLRFGRTAANPRVECHGEILPAVIRVARPGPGDWRNVMRHVTELLGPDARSESRLTTTLARALTFRMYIGPDLEYSSQVDDREI